LKLVVLAGGTGSAKLLRGLGEVARDFTVISNVGDNFWRHGLYIAPDVDIAVYTLAGIADDRRGWGLKDDTFNALGALEKLGEETWFNIGDRDLATHVFRTEQMAKGKRLGEITAMICARLGVRQRVMPCTDDRLETYIATNLGSMHLQEFWVKNRGEPEVVGVEYRGEEGARPEREALEALETADRIVFCPANPVSSLMPILAVDGIRKSIERSRARRVVVSPFVGGAPVSGPASKMMKAIGAEPSSAGLAGLYRGLFDCMIIDRVDHGDAKAIDGVEVVVGSTLMRERADEVRLAEAVVRS
jgi:LPPG:FO 2-phospho-L-lactate transferase